MTTLNLTKLGVIFSFLATSLFAQTGGKPINLAGTVVADNMTGLSYRVRGCITSVSKEATDTGIATVNQELIKLDDRVAKIAVATAVARVKDLEAEVGDREFSVTAVQAEIIRVQEEQDFVVREYERTRLLFQRGLVNETTLEAAARREMEASFALERIQEELQRALSGKSRAEIALDIGLLELNARQFDLQELAMQAPFSGVLLNFNPKVGDCVSQGALAAQIYKPNDKSVETFAFMDNLVDANQFGLTIGNSVQVIRVNGESCPGQISLLGTEANLETQSVKVRIKLDPNCAVKMFLNEGVKIELTPQSG
ncbi:HlyD family efflux transporter periplasmic adaptor subunit [Planktomarina sp.]|jgi:multidrug resistance efflux pump|nr:HlyD family secretion protein [Planktomarina sp.]MDB4841182.1 HlyD family efflux transporter periplasmic adaptor subunit [Planktomarina sp.]